MRKYLMIVSKEPGYAVRLAGVLEQRGTLPMTPAAFESGEEARRFGNSHPVAAVLADESIAAGGMLSGLSGHPLSLMLTDERPAVPMAGAMYRYCGVDEIIHRILDAFGEEAENGQGRGISRSVRLVTVYSPSLPSVKTAFALTLAAMEKRIRRTLYLNLEEFGGTGIFLKGNGDKTLADAVYYLRQDALDSVKLQSMICTSGSIDFIPSMLFADDVKEAGGEDWVRLINRIAEVSEYEEIIVDLPQSLYVGQELIDVCDELYIPVGGDSISEARMEELERYMERAEHRHMLEKVRRVRLWGNTLPPIGHSSDYPEELMYGKFGEALIREVNAGREE